MSKVHCVILNYGSTEDTVETLRSLESLASRDALSVLVVDNGSTAQSAAELQTGHSMPMTLIESKENLGFTGGCNLGIERALEEGADFVWLLNNDVIVEQQCLQELLSAAHDKDAAVVGSLIYYYPDKEKIWFAGGRIHRPWFVLQHLEKGKHKEEVSLSTSPFEVPFICGCSMLLRRDLLERFGGFDDAFFAYGEDLDLCVKVKEAGFGIYLQPRSVVWHKVSQASGGEFNPIKEYYNTRNGFVLIERHTKSALVRLFAYLSRSLWDLYRITRSTLRSGGSLLGAYRVFSLAVSDFRNKRLGKQQAKTA